MSSEYGTIFKRPKHGDPVSKVCDVDQINAVYSALEDIEGVWCRVERDGKDGKGWRIVIDGSSDINPPFPAPWANSPTMPDFPWKTTVTKSGSTLTLSMVAGETFDLADGSRYSNWTFSNQTITASGWLYFHYVAYGTGTSGVAFASSFPNRSGGNFYYPIAQITVSSGEATVKQYQFGTLPVLSTVPEEV